MNDRSTLKTKEKDDFKWYKEKIDKFISEFSSQSAEKEKMKINYDLFNGKIHLSDYENFCYRDSDLFSRANNPNRKLPSNVNIVTSKIRIVLNMQAQIPFKPKVMAVNPEAATMKKKERFSLMNQYVYKEVLQSLVVMQEIKTQEVLQDKQLSEDEKNKIISKIEEEANNMTPIEIEAYMENEFQVPAEKKGNRILNDLIESENLKDKFSESFLDALLVGKEIFFIGVLNGKAIIKNVNPINFSCSSLSYGQNIEDAEWAVQKLKMGKSEIINYFGKALKKKEIDEIMLNDENNIMNNLNHSNNINYNNNDNFNVYHCVWKSLRKVGILFYIDSYGMPQEKLVDEEYKINKDFGDKKIEWYWIPQVFEGWNIEGIGDKGLYFNLQPIEGQYNDLKEMSNPKLPYYGIIYDNKNSTAVSIMEQLKPFQYMYNKTFFEIQRLIALNQGKKTFVNLALMPDGANPEKILESWESSVQFFDSRKENINVNDFAFTVKEIDLTTKDEITSQINMLNFIQEQAAMSVGIDKRLLGQINPYETANNTNIGMTQGLHMLSVFFNKHEKVKKKVITRLIELSRMILSQNENDNLLKLSSFGIYVSDGQKTQEILKSIQQLVAGAVQGGNISLSTLLELLSQNTVSEAKAILENNENKMLENSQQEQKFLAEEEKRKIKMAQEEKEIEHQRKLELIKFEEEEKRKTAILLNDINLSEKFDKKTE